MCVLRRAAQWALTHGRGSSSSAGYGGASASASASARPRYETTDYYGRGAYEYDEPPERGDHAAEAYDSGGIGASLRTGRSSLPARN